MPSYFINDKGRVYSSSNVKIEANKIVPPYNGDIVIHKAVMVEWEGGKLTPQTVEIIADLLQFR